MKVQIVIEDKKKGKIVIPINKENLHNLYSISFMLGNGDEYKTLKLNYCDKTWRWFCENIQYISNDIVNDGKTYSMVDGKNKKTKFILNKKRWYLVRKPRWITRKCFHCYKGKINKKDGYYICEDCWNKKNGG